MKSKMKMLIAAAAVLVLIAAMLIVDAALVGADMPPEMLLGLLG